LAERAPAVELKSITKTFPGVVANDDISLSVQAGEIHAVVGENGGELPVLGAEPRHARAGIDRRQYEQRLEHDREVIPV